MNISVYKTNSMCHLMKRKRNCENVYGIGSNEKSHSETRCFGSASLNPDPGFLLNSDPDTGF